MAVYTDITDSDVEDILKAYDIGYANSLKGISEGVENSNYLLMTDKGHYILTIYEKRVEEKDLPFFLGLTEHLAERGVACPLPVAKRNGELVHHIHGKPMAIISFLLGTWPRHIRKHHMQPLGNAMGKFHSAAADFSLSRPNPWSIDGWKSLHQSLGPALNTISSDLEQKTGTEISYLEQHWPHDLPRSIIHADLFPDNVFFEHQELTGIIDFYFACEDIAAYELAICINAWCMTVDGTLQSGYVPEMIKGYEQHRTLSQSEKEALPILCRGAALRFLLTRAHDWIHHDLAALVVPKRPEEYLNKLTFHQKVTDYHDYGL